MLRNSISFILRLRSVIKGHRNNFKSKLQEFNKSWKSDAHEKAQTSAHVVDESEAIDLGDLSYIQGAHVAERELENGRAISHSRLD